MVVLALIAFELANRTVVALLGAAILVSFGVVSQEEAAGEFIDWNTIGLLAGMMVIVAILERTGVFEYLDAPMFVNPTRRGPRRRVGSLGKSRGRCSVSGTA